MQKIIGKTVLITGSSRGIGAETAQAFAKQGCNVIITFLDEIGQAETVSNKCLALGAKSTFLAQLDVRSESSIRALQKTVVLKYGGVDILVNNAAVMRWKKFTDLTYEDIEEQINVNFLGLIIMTKAFLPHVRKSIINIVGGSRSNQTIDLSVYSATKAAVRSFTEVLALETPALDIYSVSPTMTSTEMTNFHGMPAHRVAEVVVQTAKDGYGKESGEDIKVWEVGVGQHESQLLG